MKKLGITVAMLLTIGLSSISFAQQVQQTTPTQQSSVPQAIKYQAVARNVNGEAITNQNVSFRISILQGSAEGTIVYQETQASTTNQFGLANLNIGNGNIVTGAFNVIDWSKGDYFVKIEFDPKGGDNYSYMGSSQMLSVPYSLYAEHAKVADNLPAFPVKAALQGTNLQAPFDAPATGTLVYNTDSAGTGNYGVVPGYYYNAGTPAEPNWVLLSGVDEARNVRHVLAAGSNVTTYGGLVQDGGANHSVYAGFGGIVGAPSGNDNTGFGTDVFGTGINTTGADNTGAGYKALNALTSGADNTAIGSGASAGVSTASNNTVIGYDALNTNATANQNTVVGVGSLFNNVYAESNIAIGYESSYNFNSGSANYNTYNVGVGDYTLYYTGDNVSSTSLGIKNTAIGYGAVENNDHGSQNTGLGYEALKGASYFTGSFNTATGSVALYSNNSGSYNTANGDSALGGNTNGDSNTAVGYQALGNNTTGSGNTALGFEANANGSGYKNATAIGSMANALSSGSIQLGNSYVSSLYFGTGNNLPTTSTAANVYYNSTTGEFYRSTSSRRYKTNITDIDINTSLIYRLRPVSYDSKSDNSHHFGLIAEEVAQVIPGLAEYSKAKNVIKGSTSDSLVPDAVQYSLLSVLLLKEVQKHQATIQEQQQMIDDMKATLSVQADKTITDEKEIADLKQLVQSLLQAQATTKQ